MNDKEFKDWLKKERAKKKKVIKTKVKYKIITRKQGIWNIPDNF